MPELPDLEVLQATLGARVLDRRIESVRVLRPGILKTFDPPVESLIGEPFRSISRRGKHLIFTLDAALHLVVHLMVSGRLIVTGSETKATKATGFLVGMEGGQDFRLVEGGHIKRATVHVVSDPQSVPRIACAGIEPLSEAFTVEAFAKLVAETRRQAKHVLTDQTLIAGIGTSYADEILFAARISPLRYVNKLDNEETQRLHAAIRDVLSSSIIAVREQVGDGALVNPPRGHMKVYKREGHPCPVCGTRIAEIRYAQTRTYYCPTCQASGEILPDRRRWMMQ
ncbi:Fpg/Nei family DNA glycosylase [Candidatus Bipolaricaulota bacterium]|nr:Fpg/Nei family DNA glycosylase [Candidatus Bipolaricaulota bacterium]